MPNSAQLRGNGSQPRPLAMIQPQPSPAPRPMPSNPANMLQREALSALMPTPASQAQVSLAGQAFQALFPYGSTTEAFNRPESVYTEGSSFEAEVLQRLERIESLVRAPNHALPSIRSGSLVRPGEGSTQGERREIDHEGRPLGFSRSASAGEGPGVDAGKWFATDGTVPSIEGLRGSSTIQLNLTDCGTPADNLQRLIQDCGVSPMKLRDLVQELPPYPFASALVDWFFRNINYVRYPIDERSFRLSFEDMYKKKDGVGPEPGNVRSLPLIFIVLATSSRLAPEAWAGDEQTRRMTSLRMYWCCKSRAVCRVLSDHPAARRSLLIAIAIQPESLELVVTRLLSALYLVLIHDRRESTASKKARSNTSQV